MKARFLLDEQLSHRLASAGVRAGLDVVAVSGSELAGCDDLTILQAAVGQGRILVTFNIRHFAPLMNDLIHSGMAPKGLVKISPKSFHPGDLKGILRALIKLAARIERGDVDPSMGVTLTREQISDCGLPISDPGADPPWRAERVGRGDATSVRRSLGTSSRRGPRRHAEPCKRGSRRR